MIKHIYLETYGCTANQNNSELLKAKLVEAGLDIVSNPELADINIINTCIVKSPTENKVKRRIEKLSTKPTIVTGCIVPVRFKQLQKQKNIYLLSLNNLTSVNKLIRKIIENNYQEKDFISDKKLIKLGRKIRNNKFVGITQICEGCCGFCTFCITKLAKGSLCSFPEEKILKQIQQDIKEGCKEIWLTSQDNASYGLDDRKRNLPELLKKILSLEGKFKVRLGMMNPENVLPILSELVDIYKNEKMYKFLHIPVQSGSNKVLADMDRKYKIEDFLFIIKKFKAEIPNITIATDIIAAYPTETEEDFQETLNLIQKVKPDILNLSRFGPRPGTKAAKLKKIDDKTARKRTTQIMFLHRKTALENNLPLVNLVHKALFTEQEGKTYFGRTENYKIIIVKSDKNLLGKLAEVKIKEAREHCLLGEII